jgi:AAA family ATP:ADP antiporter
VEGEDARGRRVTSDARKADAGPASPLHTALRRAVDVRADEVRLMLMSFAYFFFVMCGYFVLRPIRDAVAAASGVQQLPWLFTGTLTATLLLNPLFSALVVRFPVRRFIPITYHFFIANLLVFFLLMRFASPGESSAMDVWVGRAFFVWTSVFVMFVVSIFWCFMADVFRSEQAKRLFGFIGVGGTLGSIIGSSVTAVLASRIGPVNLLLVSAALLEIAVLVVIRFPLLSRRAPADTHEAAAPAADGVIGGRVWASVTSILHSRYLLGISLFLVLYTLGSTFLYFQQSDIVGRFYPDRASRTTVLAQLELAAQGLTILTQIFFTGRIIRWIGLAATLAILPVISMLGFGMLGALPVFATLAVFTVLRRATNFSLTNPAMEVLFTVVPREDKYKAKNFIETFVYRGGDQVAAWSYAGLTALGLGLAGIAFAAIPLSVFWLMLGLWLGRTQTTLAAHDATPRGERSGDELPREVALA